MKLKTIATLIISLSLAHGAEPGQFKERERENILVKEIPPGQVLLMLEARYESESKLNTTYTGPKLFLHNKTKESLRAVEISMENCCSDEQFLVRYLGRLKPVPSWDSYGYPSLNGQYIEFPSKIENRQIVPNEKVNMTHFRVMSKDGSGTAVIFLIGPLEEVKKAYIIRLGQVFKWDSPQSLE